MEERWTHTFSVKERTERSEEEKAFFKKLMENAVLKIENLKDGTFETFEL